MNYIKKYVLGGLRDPPHPVFTLDTPKARSVLEWNGTFWSTVDKELCRGRMSHTTAVYGLGANKKKRNFA